jgi:hypothetical protein
MTDVVEIGRTLGIDVRSALGPTYADFSQIITPDDTDEEIYAKLETAAEYIGHVHDASRWWIADHLLYGEAVAGQDYYQLAERFNLAPDTLVRYRKVAEAVPRSRRRETLTFQHHQEAARISDPQTQESFLARAEEERLSVGDLRAEITAHKKSADSGVVSDQPVVEATVVPSRVVEVAKMIAATAARYVGPESPGPAWLVTDEAMAQLRSALGED